MEKEYKPKTTDKEIELEDADFMLYEALMELTKAINRLTTRF